MDDTLQIILIALIPIILAPFIRRFRRKKKLKIMVQCPHCKELIGLDRVRNYICGSCGTAVGFYHLTTGEKFENVRYEKCAECGEKNYEGVITCANCGYYNAQLIR